MAFDGNGTFRRLFSWTQDAANGVNISSSEMDGEDTGFATGLTNTVTRDGQGKMSADFLPATDNTLNLGSAIKRWLTINGIPFAQFPRYPQTAAEVTAGVTPTFYNFPAGDVRRYGADSSGVADSTAAIQQAINSNTAVFVPQGNFKFSALVMPTTFGFVFGGAGTSSTLTQTGTGITWPSTGTGPCGYYEGYIRDLAFVSTVGTGHTINTQFAGGVTLLNLYFGNMPVGFDSIHVQGSPASTGDKYSHDVHISNLQIYSNTAGRAGIYYDQYASDTSFDRFKMNGNFVVPYCIFMADGAQSVNGSNSHPYNAATNIMNINSTVATALGMTFTNVIFDNATGDNVVLTGCRTAVFTGCWWEVINSGRNGLVLNNCIGTSVGNCRFDGVAGALTIIKETGTSDYTVLLGGDCPTLGNFSNPPATFIGVHSYAKSFIAINQFGLQQVFNGSTVTSIPTNSTVFLGANGAQAAVNSTAFMIPLVSGMNASNAVFAWDTAPGVGQTYTVTLIGNGVTLTAAAGSANPLVATGAGTFGGTIAIAPGPAQFLSQFNQLYLKFVSSNGAGTPSVRYAITANG